MGLILSLFPGADVLGHGFTVEGWCVVQGPDVIWGGDVREFSVPPGRFEGVIGGPPCQCFSRLAHLTRARGLEPRFGDLVPEFARIVEEASPEWFLMENTEGATEPDPLGYRVQSFGLDASSFGAVQRRRRWFWFGWEEHRGEAPNLWKFLEVPGFKLGYPAEAVCGDARRSFIPGGQAEVDAIRAGELEAADRSSTRERRTIGELLELQGLPADWLDESPYTLAGKRSLIGNAVPFPVARALARAIREAIA